MDHQAWSQTDSMDMSQVPNDIDLSGFLDLDGGINFDMPDLDTAGFGDLQQMDGTPQNAQFDNNMSESLQASGTIAQDFGGQNQFSMGQDGGQQSFVPHGSYSAPNTNPYAVEAMQQPMMQHFPQQQNQQFQYQSHAGYGHGNHVPPTPNSFEMHGEVGRFMNKQQLDAQQRGMYNQQYHVRPDDAVAYTPLVSPAGTPHFHVQPDFTTPNSFSPLNSPMLHGQQYSQHQQMHTAYHTNPSTAPSSTAPSPANGDIDMLGESLTLPEAAPGPAKRSRRKTGTTKSSGASGRIKPSPIQKPRKRKSISLANLEPAVEANTRSNLRSAKATPTSAGLQPSSASGLSSSEHSNSSMSPEASGAAVMGPPPRPGSSLQSPAIAAQQHHASNTPIDSTTAATPKSILSNRSQRSFNGGDSTASVAEAFHDTSLEDLALPEAAKAARRPSVGRIVTSTPSNDSGDQTPRTSARKTPKIGPNGTPSAATGPPSANTSPVFSPLTGSTPSVLLKDKKDGKGGRGTSRKRGSESAPHSNTASPAIHPKISPSIKPLLPEGSKSRYSTMNIPHCRTESNSYPSHTKLSDPRPLISLEIKLPKPSRRQPLTRCLLPRSPLNGPDIQTHLPQSRRTRPPKPHQRCAKGNAITPSQSP